MIEGILVNANEKFFIDLAFDLAKSGIKVGAVITHRADCFARSPLFKDTVILDQKMFEYPSYLKTLNKNTQSCLSADILKEFLECERLFLSISDRLSFFPMSVQERIKIYQELLGYWLAFFEKNKIKGLVWDATPHMGWDNILYYVAKKHSAKTVWPELTLLRDRVLIASDYGRIYKVPGDFMKDSDRKALAGLLGKEFYDNVFRESEWTKRANLINKNIINKKPYINISGFSPVNVARRIKYLLSDALHSATFLNGVFKNIHIEIFKFINTFRIRRLRNFYSKHATKVKENKKFIFFALNYQPERSTSPKGGFFENQLLVLDMLSRSVPENWIIYVKEHPKQFHPGYLKTRHYRSIDFYKKLLSYGNIRLVKLEEDSRNLIRKAAFSATISGSVGWESLINGKACMVFGDPWYAPCNSCYVVESLEGCKAAIEEMLNKTPADIEKDMLKFLLFYKESLVLTANSYYSASRSEVKYETLVRNLTNKIKEEIGSGV